jgi:hypothetical protein
VSGNIFVCFFLHWPAHDFFSSSTTGYTGRHKICQFMALGELTRVTHIGIYFW